jgi:hypothetical protein
MKAITTAICCFILILLCILSYTYNETFIPQLHIISDEKPERLPLYISPHVSTPTTSHLLSISKNIYNVSKLNNTALIVGDAYTLHENYSKNTLFLSSVPNNDVSLILITTVQQTKKITDDGFNVGFFNDDVGKLLKTIFSSFKRPTTYKLIRISGGNITNKTFETNTINAIAVFGTKNNTKKLDDGLKIDVVDYGDLIDVQRLSVSLPFAKRSVIDFALVYPQLKGKRAQLRTVIAFDTIIVGAEGIQNKNVNVDLYKIVETLGQPEYINFYNLYFDVFKASRRYAHQSDMFALKRDSLQILEQFDGDFVRIEKIDNLDGFYNHINGTLTIKGDIINGIQLARGMKVILTAQHRKEENGIYSVTRAQTYSESVLTKDVVTKQSQEQKPYAYVCYGDQSVKSKQQCESPFDGLGKAKKVKTYWDRPCLQNDECPFYQANKNYKNYRGGCIDGRCEMPIGIEAVSYRMYNKASQASCHMCKDSTNTKCCEDQKNKKLYPQLSSPDYAFELDQFERLQQENQTKRN